MDKYKAGNCINKICLKIYTQINIFTMLFTRDFYSPISRLGSEVLAITEVILSKQRMRRVPKTNMVIFGQHNGILLELNVDYVHNLMFRIEGYTKLWH